MIINDLIEYEIQTVLQLRAEKQQKKMLAALLREKSQWFLMNGIDDKERTMFSRIKDIEWMEDTYYELDQELEMEPEVTAVQEKLNAAISDLNLLRAIEGMGSRDYADEADGAVETTPISPKLRNKKPEGNAELVSMWMTEIRKSLKEIIDDVESTYRRDREFQFRKILDYHEEILDQREINPCCNWYHRRRWKEEQDKADGRLNQYELFKILFA